MGAYTVLSMYASEQGWTEATELEVACQYIDRQQSDEAFEDFVAQVAAEENGWTVEPADDESSGEWRGRCPQCGSRWTDDRDIDECARCGNTCDLEYERNVRPWALPNEWAGDIVKRLLSVAGIEVFGALMSSDAILLTGEPEELARAEQVLVAAGGKVTLRDRNVHFDKDRIVIEWDVPWRVGSCESRQSDRARSNDSSQEE